MTASLLCTSMFFQTQVLHVIPATQIPLEKIRLLTPVSLQGFTRSLKFLHFVDTGILSFFPWKCRLRIQKIGAGNPIKTASRRCPVAACYRTTRLPHPALPSPFFARSTICIILFRIIPACYSKNSSIDLEVPLRIFSFNYHPILRKFSFLFLEFLPCHLDPG